MPDYVFNLEALPPGEYKATISILKDGRKEIAVVTKTQPDTEIPLIQVPFVISHRPLYELPTHGDLIDLQAMLYESENGKYVWVYDLTDLPEFTKDLPVVVPAEKGE